MLPIPYVQLNQGIANRFTANQVPSHGTAIYKISEYKGKVQDDGWPNAG
jgi:hypothetical protein